MRDEGKANIARIEEMTKQVSDAHDRDVATAAKNHEERILTMSSELEAKTAALAESEARRRDLSERMAIEQRLMVSAWYEVNLELQRAHAEAELGLRDGVANGQQVPHTPVSKLALLRGKAAGDGTRATKA